MMLICLHIRLIGIHYHSYNAGFIFREKLYNLIRVLPLLKSKKRRELGRKNKLKIMETSDAIIAKRINQIKDL